MLLSPLKLEALQTWKKKIVPLTGSPTVLAKMDIWLVPTLKFTAFSNSKDFSSWVP